MYKATCSPKHITRYEETANPEGDQKKPHKNKTPNQPKNTKENEKEID